MEKLVSFKEMFPHGVVTREQVNDILSSRVVITNSSKKWANGMRGTIIEILAMDAYDPFRLRNNPRVMIKLDDMDTNKPPFNKWDFDVDEFMIIAGTEDDHDPVNHPSHYTDGKYEVIDYIESKNYHCNFCLGNAVKYISRAGKKDPEKKKEDLKKAIWYLNRWLPFFKGNTPSKSPIDTKDYILDKGLNNSPCGMALELIEKREYELAIQALKMEVDEE